jgi:transcriptional regulator with XRE-family HTH domain
MTTQVTSLRVKYNLTIERLSEISGVPSNVIRRLEEKGTKPTRRQISALAKALKVKSQELLN